MSMRQGSDRDEFVGVNGEVIGFHLSADHCAEHEWGIKGIKRDLGITGEGFGIENRTITNADSVVLFKFTKRVGNRGRKKQVQCACLTNYTRYDGKPIGIEDVTEYISDFRYTEGDKQTAGAWNEEHFMFAVSGAEHIDALEMVYNAFKTNDIAVFLSNGAVFKNAGLSFAMVSRFPADVAKQMEDTDKSQARLNKAFADTGIADLLRKAGKQYFALSPRWTDDDETDLRYWLNPMDQANNNYGWFTLDDLKQWAENRGPIPKKGN